MSSSDCFSELGSQQLMVDWHRTIRSWTRDGTDGSFTSPTERECLQENLSTFVFAEMKK